MSQFMLHTQKKACNHDMSLVVETVLATVVAKLATMYKSFAAVIDVSRNTVCVSVTVTLFDNKKVASFFFFWYYLIYSRTRSAALLFRAIPHTYTHAREQ